MRVDDAGRPCGMGGVVDAVDPADFEETLLQFGLATSTSSLSGLECGTTPAGALDVEEVWPIELLECGTTPAGALDHEELLGVELLECRTTPAGALDHEELLPVELDPREVFFFFLKRQELRIECCKVQFRYFRNELFWQELDIVLVGPGLQQISTTNQAAPALGP